MARSTGERKGRPLDSRIPGLEKVPTLDELMRRLEIPEWLKPIPPPVMPEKDPFDPVPIIPPPAPTWPYGPPHLGAPMPAPQRLTLTTEEQPGGLPA